MSFLPLAQPGHSTLPLPLDLGLSALKARLFAAYAGWLAARREDAELARLDYREKADLSTRQ